jgi:hypothetical protein
LHLFLYFAPGFFVLALVLTFLDKEHRRLWLAAAGSMVPFCLWVTVASFPQMLRVAPGFLVVPPAMAVILAIFDRKYRVFWVAVVGFWLLGACAFVYGFFWVLSGFSGK